MTEPRQTDVFVETEIKWHFDSEIPGGSQTVTTPVWHNDISDPNSQNPENPILIFTGYGTEGPRNSKKILPFLSELAIGAVVVPPSYYKLDEVSEEAQIAVETQVPSALIREFFDNRQKPDAIGHSLGAMPIGRSIGNPDDKNNLFGDVTLWDPLIGLAGYRHVPAEKRHVLALLRLGLTNPALSLFHRWDAPLEALAELSIINRALKDEKAGRFRPYLSRIYNTDMRPNIQSHLAQGNRVVVAGSPSEAICKTDLIVRDLTSEDGIAPGYIQDTDRVHRQAGAKRELEVLRKILKTIYRFDTDQ